MTLSTIADRARRVPRGHVIVIAAHLVVMLAIFFHMFYRSGLWRSADVRLYGVASHRMLLLGQAPYRDFPLEYPPGALLAFAVPHLVALGRPLGIRAYTWLFAAASVALSVALAAVLSRLARRVTADEAEQSAALAAYAGGAAVLAPLLLLRFDLFVAALTALSLLCLVTRRPAWAGITLGVAVAAKLYPVVLGPVWAAYYLSGRDLRSLARLTAGGMAAVAATVGPFLALAPVGLLGFLRYHAQRGLQAETVFAAPVLLGRALGLNDASLKYNFGAEHLVSPFADRLLPFLPLLFLVAYVLVIAACVERFRQERAEMGTVRAEVVAAYALIALLAFVVTNKVFSSQYVVWLLPFAALLPGRRVFVLLAVCALTAVVFLNWQAVVAFSTPFVLLLNVRNVLVVAWLVWLVAAYRPAPARVSRRAAAH